MSKHKSARNMLQSLGIQDKIAFLQKLVDLSPNLLFVIDLENQGILYVNDKVKDLLGCEQEFVIKQGTEIFRILIHPEDQELGLDNLKRCLQLPQDENCEMEIRFHTSEKIWQWFKIKSEVFDRDINGNASHIVLTAQNIHEQKMREKRQREDDNRKRSTEIVAGMGSYEVEFESNKIYFSDGLFRLFGYEPGEFEPSQQWVDEHSHQDDVVLVQQILDEAVQNNKGYYYTRRIYRKDGELRILESHGNIIVDDIGNPVKFIGIVQDVTERKQADEELGKSEERSRNLIKVLQKAPDAYLVLATDLIIEMASDSYLEATNTSREEIVGKQIFEVFPDNPATPNAHGVKNLTASLQTVLSTKKPHRMAIQQYDVKLHDGKFEEKYWSPSNTPVLNAEGEVEYIIHRVLDITDVVKKQVAVKGLVTKTEMLKTSLDEIKLQANQIQQNSILLQSIFDASPYSIVLYETLYNKEDEIEDFQFVMLNAFNEELLGRTHELVGKLLTKEFPEVKENGILGQFKKTAETNIATDFEAKYQGNGLNHFFHISATKLGDKLVVTSEDITERKKIEETIHQMLHGSYAGIAILESIRNNEGKIENFLFKKVNRAAERISRSKKEDIEGKKLFDIFPGAKGLFFDTYKRVVETGEPLNMQEYYPFNDLDIWMDVSAVKNGDGFIMTFHDITEQKKKEQELVALKEKLAQKTTDKYKKILNSLDEGYALLELIFDEKGECFDFRYLEINPVFERHSGMSNVLGRTIKEMVPNIEPFWFENYSKVVSTGESLRFDVYSHSLGRWLDVYAFKIDSQEDNHVAVIFNDITGRKEAEERQTFLLKLNDALRPLGDPMEIQYTAMQILGAHLKVNRAYYAEAMEDEDTLQSRPGYLYNVGPVAPEGKLTDFDEDIRKILLEGKTLVLDDVIGELDLPEEIKEAVIEGQMLAAIGVPLVKNGRLVAVVGVHQAVPRKWTPAEVSLVVEVCEYIWAAVERARAENALRESEQRFRDLVEASAIAVWETNAEGIAVSDSPSWRAFTGQSIEEWLHSGWKAVHPDDSETAATIWKNAVESLQKIDFEYRLRSADGKYRWTNILATPILDREGKVKKWAGMNLDIHERKLTEEALIKAKEEAEAASRAKEDFVSTMSHEIRTPLNAVIGLTNLLLENEPREDQTVNLNSLSFSAQNLLSLINDILDFSKLEAGKSEVEQNDFHLPNLILSLEQLYKPQARNNRSKLTLQIDDDIPDYIVTDQLKLSQILHNLLSNAVKFTHDGKINFEISLSKKENDILWLEFSIQDSGIGIPKDKLAYIFEKFSQAESSTVRQYGGTGLGLTITKLLLELMGSKIQVDSEAGKGSRFYFSLPVKEATYLQAEPEPENQEDEEIYDLSNLRILVVEDVEINRNILIQFFSKWWNLQPAEAVNGKEAVKMAQQKSYDLILMDVRMPVMDGYEATGIIRGIRGYEHVPILALTADKSQEVQQMDQATKFDDLLTKPFDPVQLRKRILHHLNLKRINVNSTPTTSKEINDPTLTGRKTANGREEGKIHYSLKKYQSLAGENKEVLNKFINSSLKALDAYKKEFCIAASNLDVEAISGLIHKNTLTLHYVEAKILEESIYKYREDLLNTENLTSQKKQFKNIIGEFNTVISGVENALTEDKEY